MARIGRVSVSGKDDALMLAALFVGGYFFFTRVVLKDAKDAITDNIVNPFASLTADLTTRVVDAGDQTGKTATATTYFDVNGNGYYVDDTGQTYRITRDGQRVYFDIRDVRPADAGNDAPTVDGFAPGPLGTGIPWIF